MYLNLRSVIYNVDDLQKAKDWYGKVLDAKPVIDQSSFVSFSIGNDKLGLNLVDHSLLGDGSTSAAYWAVSDIRAEYKRLIENGAVEQGGIRDMGEGLLLATVKDPFGNILGISGMSGIPDNKAIEAKPSKTALWTTHMRALSTIEKHEEIRGQDNLAEIFLPKDARDALQNLDNRQQIKEKNFVIGVYEYVIARTKLFDRFFTQAINEDVEQIVFLGAGYDSRPYRFRELTGTVKIFELDISPTQEHKKQCLARVGIDPPPNLIYVPINFNTQSIKDVLIAADFDKNKKTLFMWEGVTFYLGAEAVVATLEFIKSNSPSGSIVAFDYIALWPGIFDAYGVKELIEFNAAKQSGESGNNFALEEGSVESFLLEKGFKISTHQNSEELEKNFLTLKDGTLFGHVTGSFRIVQAVTAG
jgi:methyltransferase (TIGR00027 family)